MLPSLTSQWLPMGSGVWKLLLADLGSLNFFLVELIRRAEGAFEASLKMVSELEGLMDAGPGVTGYWALWKGVLFVISDRAVCLPIVRKTLSVFKGCSSATRQ